MTEHPKQQSLKHRTIRGVRLTVLATVSSMLLQSATLVVLARLLKASDYGSVAAAMIFTQPLQTTLLSGTERAIVLQSDLSDEALSSALFALLALTGCLAALLAAAGLSLWLANGGDFGLVLALLSPTLILSGACLPARAHLRYKFGFGRIGLCDLFAQLAGTGGVGIFCALHGFGPYSLVLASLTQVTLQGILYWTLSGSKVRPNFNFNYVRKLASLSYQVARISILDTMQGQFVFAFTWLYSGHSALGILNRACYLIQLPTQLLINALTRVLFTGFTLVKEERERLIRAMQMLVEVSSVIIFPLTAGMAAAAPQLIDVVLGKNWTSAEPMMRWLALGIALMFSGHLFAVMAEAVGRLQLKFYIQIGATLAALPIYIVLARYGLVGSSLAFAASWAVYFIGQVALASRILDMRMRQFVRWLLPGLISAAVIVAYVLILRLLTEAHLNEFVLFALEVIGCAAALVATLAVFFFRLLLEIMLFAGLGNWTRRLFHEPRSGSAGT